MWNLMFELIRHLAATRPAIVVQVDPGTQGQHADPPSDDTCKSPRYTHSGWEQTGSSRTVEGEWVVERIYYERTRTDTCTGTENMQHRTEGPNQLWPAVPKEHTADVNRPAATDGTVSGSPLRTSDMPASPAGGLGPQDVVLQAPRSTDPTAGGAQSADDSATWPEIGVLVGLAVAATQLKVRKMFSRNPTGTDTAADPPLPPQLGNGSGQTPDPRSVPGTEGGIQGSNTNSPDGFPVTSGDADPVRQPPVDPSSTSAALTLALIVWRAHLARLRANKMSPFDGTEPAPAPGEEFTVPAVLMDLVNQGYVPVVDYLDQQSPYVGPIWNGIDKTVSVGVGGTGASAVQVPLPGIKLVGSSSYAKLDDLDTALSTLKPAIAEARDKALQVAVAVHAPPAVQEWIKTDDPRGLGWLADEIVNRKLGVWQLKHDGGNAAWYDQQYLDPLRDLGSIKLAPAISNAFDTATKLDQNLNKLTQAIDAWWKAYLNGESTKAAEEQAAQARAALNGLPVSDKSLWQPGHDWPMIAEPYRRQAQAFQSAYTNCWEAILNRNDKAIADAVSAVGISGVSTKCKLADEINELYLPKYKARYMQLLQEAASPNDSISYAAQQELLWWDALPQKLQGAPELAAKLQVGLDSWKGEWKFSHAGPPAGALQLQIPFSTASIRQTTRYRTSDNDHSVVPHTGIDLVPNSSDWTIHPAAAGRVVYAGPDPASVDKNGRVTIKSGYGNVVIIDHGHGRYTMYDHLEKFTVGDDPQAYHVGDLVTTTTKLGTMGTTGHSTGPHLHFEVRVAPGGNPPADGDSAWIHYGTTINPEMVLADGVLMDDIQRKKKADLVAWFATTMDNFAKHPEYEAYIAQAISSATASGKPVVPANIIKAIIAVESQGKATTVNDQNSNGTADVGIMQLNDCQGLSREDRLDPQKSIEYAVKSIVQPNMQQFNANDLFKWHRILEAYNRGSETVASHGDDFPLWQSDRNDGDDWLGSEGLLYSDRVLYELWLLGGA